MGGYPFTENKSHFLGPQLYVIVKKIIPAFYLARFELSFSIISRTNRKIFEKTRTRIFTTKF